MDSDQRHPSPSVAAAGDPSVPIIPQQHPTPPSLRHVQQQQQQQQQHSRSSYSPSGSYHPPLTPTSLSYSYTSPDHQQQQHHHIQRPHHRVPSPHPPAPPPPLPAQTHPQSLSASVPPTPVQSTPPTPGLRANPLQDHKRPRACESCRSLKVRCEPHDSAAPTGTCRRCSRASRECIFTVPTRKRQKKVDSKVVELERKIEALTASLTATQGARNQHVEAEADEDYEDMSDIDPEPSPDVQHTHKRRRSNGNEEDVREAAKGFLPRGTRFVAPSPPVPDNERFLPHVEYVDVIDQQLVSVGTADELLKHYMEEISSDFPAVVFHPGTTVADLRKTKPTLLLAVLSIASASSHPSIHRDLQRETNRAFAERIMVNAEKSIELVQALLVMSIWYYPVEPYEELKFYTLINMAAMMALDIGLGRMSSHNFGCLPEAPRPPVNSALDKRMLLASTFNSLTTDDSSFPPGPSRMPKVDGEAISAELPTMVPNIPPLHLALFPDPTTVEARRTLLACYWTCSHVSVSLRRPNMLRFTNFMRECLKVLDTSPEALPSDKVLVQWVLLQIVAEEASVTFEFDDPCSDISMEDSRMRLAVRGFARRLEEWKKTAPQSTINKSILLNYYVTTIYVHEIALHVNHNVDDFRPPFTERIIREPSLKAHVLVPGYQLSSISDCVSASQALLETFLTYSIPELLCVPVFTFVRTVYACLMLIKISVTASVPDGELGKLINNDELQTEEYINRTRVHMGKAAQDDRSRPARKFTMILLRLQTWYLKRIAELVPLKPQSSETVMENNESPRTNTTAEAVPRTADPHQESSAHLQRLSNANLASETTGDQDKLRQPQMQPQQQLTCYPEQQQIQQPMNSNYYANPVDSGWPSRESVGLGAEGTAGFVGFPVAQLVPLDNSLTDDSFWEMMHPQGNIGDGTWQGDPGAPWSGYSL